MLSQFLNTTRIKDISDEIEDIRGIPTTLLGLQRVSVVPCEQDEIFMRVSGRTIAADILPDGAAAMLKSMPPVRLTLEHVPNIKGGRAMDQSDLTKLKRLDQSGLPGDFASADMMLTRHVDDAIWGCKVTMNRMIWGMLQSSLTYSKAGTIVTITSWGTPSDLLVTPANLWTDATNGKPITDINTLVELGRVKYGVIYDRITLSTTALRNASKTAEFITLATNQLVVGGVGTFINSSDIKDVASLMSKLCGLEVVIYDETYDDQDNAGTITTSRFLLVNKVVLDCKSSDNNPRVVDFGNAHVDEATVASIIGHKSPVIGDLPGDARGPVAYAEGEFNPPRVGIWAVVKGFVRLHKETARAVLTVG